MKDTLRYIEKLSRQRIKDAGDVQTVAQLQERSAAPPKTPMSVRGMEFTSEGVETPVLAGSEVGLTFSLPSDTVRWNIKPARYRVSVQTRGPAVLDVNNAETGEAIIRSRRTGGRAVLDIRAGAVEMTATSPIEDVEVLRYDNRASGEIILGPYRAEGVIEAETVGHGSWTTEVASNPMVAGELSVEGTPRFTGSGEVWRGQSLQEKQPGRPESPMLYWSVANRFPGAPNADLKFRSSVRAGRTYSGHTKTEITQPKPTPSGAFWKGIGQWRVMGGSDAPAFDPRPALWTYVWGQASGHERAYDARTGRPAEPTSQGVYLIRTTEPSSVEIDGTHAGYGAPFTADSKQTITPGTYAQAAVTDAPKQVFVRLKGKGLAREIKLKETRKRGPQGMSLTDTRRIDLAEYFRPGIDRTHNLTTGGRGAFLPAAARQ